MLKTMNCQSQLEKVLFQLEVIEFQYFMSCKIFIKNWILNFSLVTLVGILSQAVIHLLKIFQHMLTALKKPHMELLPPYVKDLILLPKFTT